MVQNIIVRLDQFKFKETNLWSTIEQFFSPVQSIRNPSHYI